MVFPGQNPTVGTRLKEIRARLGLTTREVETKSQQVADDRHNREFYLSHAWLTDIENDKFLPSLFKLFTLSAVYRCSFPDLASMVGVPLGELPRLQRSMDAPKTHLLQNQGREETEKVPVPVRIKPEFQLEKTDLVARVVEKWGQLPVSLLQHIDLRRSVYGYIGLEDYTLYPLIRPGSLVQIDSTQRKLSAKKWSTEYDRPIYFVELHDGYVCSWCEVDRGQLIVVPHPQSRQSIRRFDYPAQAEIIGRVTGVAMRIVDLSPETLGEQTKTVGNPGPGTCS
jgi:transcriptional regulator with XRE-family HTH domain